MITSSNPATGDVLMQLQSHSDGEVESKLEQAARAQKEWARTPLEQRLALLRKVAETLRRDKEALARLITLEMGKPLAEAVGEVEKCAWNFEFYADSAPGFLSDQLVKSSATDRRIVYDPLGLVRSAEHTSEL